MLSLLHHKKLLALAGQALYSGGSLVLTLLLSRWLGPAGFGAYSTLLLGIYLLVSVLNALVIQPFQVNLAREVKQEAYISFTFWSQVALVVFLLAIGLGLAALGQLTPGAVVYAGGFLLHDYFRKVILARGQVVQAMVVDALAVFCQVGAIGFAYLTQDLEGVLQWMGGAWIPALAAGVLLLKPSLHGRAHWRGYLHTHLAQGKWLVMTAGVQWWSGNLFVVASGLVLGVEALGAFRLVQSLFGVLNIILQSFENYALPEVTRLYVQSEMEAKIYLRQITRKAGLLFGGMLLVLFLLADEVIELAGGAQYAGYGYVVQGMAVLYALIFVGYPVRMAIRMLVLNSRFFMGYVWSLAFSLVSFRFLLEQWNLAGAVVGLMMSQVVVLVYWQFVLYKKSFQLWKSSI